MNITPAQSRELERRFRAEHEALALSGDPRSFMTPNLQELLGPVIMENDPEFRRAANEALLGYDSEVADRYGQYELANRNATDARGKAVAWEGFLADTASARVTLRSLIFTSALQAFDRTTPPSPIQGLVHDQLQEALKQSKGLRLALMREAL